MTVHNVLTAALGLLGLHQQVKFPTRASIVEDKLTGREHAPYANLTRGVGGNQVDRHASGPLSLFFQPRYCSSSSRSRRGRFGNSGSLPHMPSWPGSTGST